MQIPGEKPRFPHAESRSSLIIDDHHNDRVISSDFNVPPGPGIGPGTLQTEF